jgi:AcrR family transcriptional regulator/DNA-binding transcriptional ArsR family regulator
LTQARENASVPGVAVRTVDQRQREFPANPRARALTRRIAELGLTRPADDARLEALALGVVDALLDADETTLRTALEALRDARRRALAAEPEPGPERERLLGWLAGMIAVAHWALERLTPETTVAAIAAGSQAHLFLQALEPSPPVGSAQLRQLLETDETQVSRTGRRLLESGLVTRRKVGRKVFWELTPRGRRALEAAPARSPAPSPHADSGPAGASFWMEAIRRGFEGAAGDEPGGERRDVDPTRERIVVSTLALHKELGIQATSWPQIASRAGVPVETVEAYFPTLDDLVMGCGQHYFESLRLPPPERAAEIFAGAGSEQERVQRLVDTIFGAYEREGPGLEGARRERAQLPVVDEGLEQLDVSLDALVAEALRPRRPDPSSIAAVRALTDLTVWRALRDQGASPDASVQQASAAVERWLEARPARATSERLG